MYILLPMDETGQRNHLKAYGITYWVLNQGVEAYWLLNYKGGSFAFVFTPTFEKECKTRDVSYEVIADAQFAAMQNEILNPEVNQDVIKLEKAPKIAVYTPDKNEKGEVVQPWDDAVTMVLTYAEIPYDVLYDTEVLNGKLLEYDWLHLHHEDFTGMFGKFYASNSSQPSGAMQSASVVITSSPPAWAIPVSIAFFLWECTVSPGRMEFASGNRRRWGRFFSASFHWSASCTTSAAVPSSEKSSATIISTR